MTYVTIAASRDAYRPEGVNYTLTVEELRDALDQFEPDALVVISNDNGYTYGGVSWETVDCLERD